MMLTAGSAGSGKNDFRGAEHDRTHGSQDSHAHAVVDPMSTCSGKQRKRNLSNLIARLRERGPVCVCVCVTYL